MQGEKEVMKTTEQQREELEALELQLMDNMSSISKDFAIIGQTAARGFVTHSANTQTTLFLSILETS